MSLENKVKLPPSLSTLAIGSVPFLEVSTALDLLGANLDIPAYPQMARLKASEDMLLGAVDGLAIVKVENGTILAPLNGREEALADFYQKYLSDDRSFLALGPDSSLGFTAFLERAKIDTNFGKIYLKSQVVGPLTFGQAVKLEGGYNLIDDFNLMEAVSLGLGGKAAWEAGLIRELGRSPIVFIDEPGLSGYGSAFSTLSAEAVVKFLGSAVEAAKASGPVLVGCHVCGNTDWGLLTKVGLDIINFDSYEFAQTVALYPKEIKGFLDSGGALAWGVVPTRDFGPETNPLSLAKKIWRGWEGLATKGLDWDLIKERALITTACGLGSLSLEKAEGALKILPQLKSLL
ncbi:MAG: hypothetical protein LBV23_05765 [Deltaproteobacteria bacterium]|jgi:hypothetical protein|nr:hypothetical protein [Deltaproteobacteria bacterium]